MKKIHLAWFGGAGPDDWQSKAAGESPFLPDGFQESVRACERAKLDLVLFADVQAIPSTYLGSRDYYLREGFAGVGVDPVPLLAMCAAVTSRIGFVSTLSTTFYPPFLLARLLASLDHLTAGRIGWNVVTTASAEAARNYGLEDLPDHDSRYDMADEYLKLCRALWDSWERDALVIDRERGIFADPAKVHAVDFEGKYYRSTGPLNVPPSPQHHPVVCVAGASPRGRRFSAEHAEMAIAHKNSVEEMRTYSEDIRTRLSDQGRDPASCKIFFSIKPVIGETAAIAQERAEARATTADVDRGLAWLSTTLGYDMSQFDLDQPLPGDLNVNALQGKLLQHYSDGRTPTLREISMHEALYETFEICGTPAHVADVLEDAAIRGGADGFHVRAPITDHRYMIDFLDQVVPELQRRGMFRTEYAGTTLREHLLEY